MGVLILDILIFVMWALIGSVNLCGKEPISKSTYGLTWGVLMLCLFLNILNSAAAAMMG